MGYELIQKLPTVSYIGSPENSDIEGELRKLNHALMSITQVHADFEAMVNLIDNIEDQIYNNENLIHNYIIDRENYLTTDIDKWKSISIEKNELNEKSFIMNRWSMFCYKYGTNILHDFFHCIEYVEFYVEKSEYLISNIDIYNIKKIKDYFREKFGETRMLRNGSIHSLEQSINAKRQRENSVQGPYEIPGIKNDSSSSDIYISGIVSPGRIWTISSGSTFFSYALTKDTSNDLCDMALKIFGESTTWTIGIYTTNPWVLHLHRDFTLRYNGEQTHTISNARRSSYKMARSIQPRSFSASACT